jgi:MFS family permease
MLVDALVSRGWNAPLVRKVVLVAGTACGLGILGAAHAHSAGRALAWISLSIGGLAAAAPVGWSIPALITPRASVGKVGGIVNFVCQVSGITAQILTGYIVRATHSYALAFGISAIYLLLGIAGYLVLLGRIEPMKINTTHFPAV